MDDTMRFDHLARLTTPLGLYEHALLDQPRTEHGMCVDDAARALVVTVRVTDPSPQVAALTRIYLDFVVAAQHDDGSMHNRRNLDGSWADEASTHDHWGRALWALGTAAATSTDPVVAARAADAAQTAVRGRSRWMRATSYAVLGAAALLDRDPDDAAARRLLRESAGSLRRARMDRTWPWPEDSLTYANAVLPQAMLLTGRHLDSSDLRDDGRYLLRWLIDQQTIDGHLSMVPVAGRARWQTPSVAFDQQPIEVAALAEACRTAHVETGDDRWRAVVDDCMAWFEGDNDSGTPVRDAETGAGYDGLEPGGVNQNRGAESTLAWLATQQLALLGRIPVPR
ncbi:MAG TPA: hypothetical protein VFL59_16095 [Candidatus Nanopelagicales bacterium]|nr:hypothetical protein [Candidatus Nanopelagicales bacterium]